jgi:hypothetical protein
MKKMIEDLFDIFFPKDIDENGIEIEHSAGDDSYTTKVFTIVMLIIIVIFAFIGLK